MYFRQICSNLFNLEKSYRNYTWLPTLWAFKWLRELALGTVAIRLAVVFG